MHRGDIIFIFDGIQDLRFGSANLLVAGLYIFVDCIREGLARYLLKTIGFD